MKSRYLICILIFTLPSYGHAQHSGYWNEFTPKGDSFDCRRVRTEAELMRDLRKAGWPMNKTPVINFATDDAIIISPSSYYKTHKLVFYGLKRRDGHNYLGWGWHRIGASETVQQSDGTYMTSSGSEAETASTQTMVVSMNASYIGPGFVCSRSDPD